MRYWKTEDGALVEGTKLEYYAYKLQCLKNKRDELNEEYYCREISEYLEKIKKEMEI